MQTNKLAVGDTSGDGQLSSADQPPANGQLYTARSGIFKPQSSLPAFDAREGELVYNDSDNKFYYYDGSGWVAQGGASGSVLYLACPWGSDFTAGTNQGWGNQCGAGGTGCCTPAACPSGWTSAGPYAEPVSVACSGGTYCGWVYTTNANHPVAVGRAVRACVKN